MFRWWQAAVVFAVVGPANAADLSLQRVMLSSGSVGYLEYEAVVDGDIEPRRAARSGRGGARDAAAVCRRGDRVIPWSPQARGKLTRNRDYTSTRTETDEAFGRLFAKTEDADRKVVDRVAQVAAGRGIPRAQVALAWVLAKPAITAPIVGATKLQHLDDALASVRVKLCDDEIALLEELYVPHAVVGFD